MGGGGHKAVEGNARGERNREGGGGVVRIHFWDRKTHSKKLICLFSIYQRSLWGYFPMPSGGLFRANKRFVNSFMCNMTVKLPHLYYYSQHQNLHHLCRCFSIKIFTSISLWLYERATYVRKSRINLWLSERTTLSLD